MTDVPYEMEYQVVLQVQVSRCQTIVFDVSRTAHHQDAPSSASFLPVSPERQDARVAKRREADARGTLRRTAHAESVRLPRQRSKVGSPSAVLFPPRPSRSPRSFRGLRRAREARPAISSHPPRASDAIGSGKMAEGLQINPDRELTFRCASPTRGVVNPARPARDRWSPRPALVVPPRFARHFPRARAPRADDPDSFADAPVSPVRAPLNSQSSSRSRSRRRSACTTPARPRWPSR